MKITAIRPAFHDGQYREAGQTYDWPDRLPIPEWAVLAQHYEPEPETSLISSAPGGKFLPNSAYAGTQGPDGQVFDRPGATVDRVEVRVAKSGWRF